MRVISLNVDNRKIRYWLFIRSRQGNCVFGRFTHKRKWEKKSRALHLYYIWTKELHEILVSLVRSQSEWVRAIFSPFTRQPFCIPEAPSSVANCFSTRARPTTSLCIYFKCPSSSANYFYIVLVIVNYSPVLWSLAKLPALNSPVTCVSVCCKQTGLRFMQITLQFHKRLYGVWTSLLTHHTQTSPTVYKIYTLCVPKTS